MGRGRWVDVDRDKMLFIGIVRFVTTLHDYNNNDRW